MAPQMKLELNAIKTLNEGAYSKPTVRFDKIVMSRSGSFFYYKGEMIASIPMNIDPQNDTVEINSISGILELDIA